MAFKKDKNGRWRDEKGHFVKAPKSRPKAKPKAKPKKRVRDSKGRFLKKPVKKPARPRDEHGRFIKPSDFQSPGKETVTENALRLIDEALQYMAVGASGFAETAISSHLNADGSIDGECRVTDISHSISIDDMLRTMEQFAIPVHTGSHLFPVNSDDTTTWMQIFLLRPVRTQGEKKSDTLEYGMPDEYTSLVATHWRQAMTYGIASAFLQSREINDNFSAKRRLRVHTILYRLSFNPQGVRPS